jgi:hypothetical protein
MAGNIFRFRTLKHGDPEHKLKMLPDDLGVPRWRVWLTRYGFYCVVAMCFAASLAAGRYLLR